jgi:hypothetical protein
MKCTALRSQFNEMAEPAGLKICADYTRTLCEAAAESKVGLDASIDRVVRDPARQQSLLASVGRRSISFLEPLNCSAQYLRSALPLSAGDRRRAGGRHVKT